MPADAPDDHRSLPELLRAARGGYAQAVRAHLSAEGIEDLPRNGAFALASVAGGAEAEQLARGLGVSKQAVSQLVDTLVHRGYLFREANPADRRRVTLVLTDRGRAAAAVVLAATAAVDREVAGLLTTDELTTLRAGLSALGQIGGRLGPTP